MSILSLPLVSSSFLIYSFLIHNIFTTTNTTVLASSLATKKTSKGVKVQHVVEVDKDVAKWLGLEVSEGGMLLSLEPKSLILRS